MNKNIRRTIVLAAGVSGAWALGSAAASADELPAHSLSVPDRIIDAAEDISAAGTHEAGAGAQGTVAQVTGAAETAHGVVGGAAGTAQGTVHGAGDVAHGAVAQATGAAQEKAAQEEVDYLFGPLSAFAPELQAQAQQAPAELGAQVAQAPVELGGTTARVQPLGQALGGGSGHVLGQWPGGGQRTLAAPSGPAATSGPAVAGAPMAVSGPADVVAGGEQVVMTGLRVVGDAMYLAQGVQGSLTAGELPSVSLALADTQRLVERAVSGLAEAAGLQVPEGRQQA